ncbi:MAG: homoserine O-acetyltransferase [Deltaproteobacteria bacterium RBG_13_61_14]|nr:MAG: homoserine O-acetyltransferase [Deltaproteobacteria bacterium RBG_13_61_14]
MQKSALKEEFQEVGSVGLVKTHSFTFAQTPEEMVLESGARLGPITLAYETYGELDAKKQNAILICHALSGDAHVAGYHSKNDPKPGWWNNMVGPGRPFDTRKYFVICSNIIGGCQGSTGPGSPNPATGKPYGLEFPILTVADMVKAQRELVQHLGISRLLNVVGGSLGGMQALQWAVSFPELVKTATLLATTSKLSAQGIAFNEVSRRAIMADPKWQRGDYYDRPDRPDDGLALARMIAHITYLSEQSLHDKFGRRLQDQDRLGDSFSTEFQVESYLHHQGDVFIKRFDANSYLYISKAIDYFDLTRHGELSLAQALRGVKSKFLVVAFKSDWLYPAEQSKEIVRALKKNNAEVTYALVDAPYGHDSFLLPNSTLEEMIVNFLGQNYRR